jgi:hypothetical protein
MKKSIVISCEYDKPYQINNDTIHYHRLVLQNGDSGNCGVTEMFSSKIAVGTEITYTFENGRIKLVNQVSAPTNFNAQQNTPMRPKQQSFPSEEGFTKKFKKSPEDAITFIMGYASNRHVAKITALKKDIPVEEMLEDADKIYEHYKRMLNQ